MKNVIPFRIGRSLSAKAIESGLEGSRFASCGRQQMLSAGWIDASGVPGDEQLVFPLGNGIYRVRLCIEKRLLPGAVVKKHLAEKIQAITSRQGHPPGRKQQRDLKEEVLQELMPRSFTRIDTLDAVFSPDRQWLLVGTSSRKSAEDLVARLIALDLGDGAPALPVSEISPSVAMTDWLVNDEAPAGLSIDTECELTSDNGKVRYSSINLSRDDIRTHIREGRMAASLALTLEDKVSFTLLADFRIRKISAVDPVEPDEDVAAGLIEASLAFDVVDGIAAALGGLAQ